jgi:hypothetical protein
MACQLRAYSGGRAMRLAETPLLARVEEETCRSPAGNPICGASPHQHTVLPSTVATIAVGLEPVLARYVQYLYMAVRMQAVECEYPQCRGAATTLWLDGSPVGRMAMGSQSHRHNPAARSTGLVPITLMHHGTAVAGL